MDILVSSNFERLLFLLSGDPELVSRLMRDMKEKGVYQIPAPIREKLSVLPGDVRLKKLAGELVTAGQAGPYNYGRAVSRGEKGAAALALGEFAKAVLHVASS